MVYYRKGDITDPNLIFFHLRKYTQYNRRSSCTVCASRSRNRPGFKKHKKLWTLKQGLNSDVMFD